MHASKVLFCVCESYCLILIVYSSLTPDKLCLRSIISMYSIHVALMYAT